MGRFDFQSPGAAVTDALTRLVTQRKLEARQNLQDQLSVEANQRANQQAQEEHDWKQFQEQMQTQKNEADRVDQLTSSMSLGMDPESLGLDPKDIELLKRHAKLKQMPVVPGAEGQPAKPKYSFVGTPKEQDEEQLRRETGNMLTQMLANKDPKKQELAQELVRRATANHGIITEKMWSDAGFGPQHEVISVDPDTNKQTSLGMFGPNAEVHFNTRPPKQPMWQWAGDSDEGTTLFNPFSGETKVVPNAHHLRPIAPTGGKEGAANKLGISPVLMGNINTAAVGFNSDPEDPTAIGHIRASVKEAIVSSLASPIAKRLAAMYVDDPDAYRAALQQTALTQKDIDDLQQLRTLVPNEALGAIKSHPFRVK